MRILFYTIEIFIYIGYSKSVNKEVSWQRKGVVTMSFYYGISSDSVSSLFSTASTTSTGSSGSIL